MSRYCGSLNLQVSRPSWDLTSPLTLQRGLGCDTEPRCFLNQSSPTAPAYQLRKTIKEILQVQRPGVADMSRRPQLVLVHGAGHGAWCWYKIRSLLETSGYKVTCLDLKAAGIHPTDPNTIFTLDDYDHPLLNFLSNLPHNQKVILVGHSAGGLSLTDAIHSFPHKIHMAIYVAANMLKHGFSTDQDRKDAEPDLSSYGNVSEIGYGMGPDQPPTSAIICEQFQRQILYNMSPEEDAILASMLLRPAPVRAFRGARFVGGPDVDRVPRVYIKTMHDRVLKPEQQDAMIKRWPPSKVFVLESDHSPFFSTPSMLFGFLVEAAASVKCI